MSVEFRKGDRVYDEVLNREGVIVAFAFQQSETTFDFVKVRFDVRFFPERWRPAHRLYLVRES